MQLLESAQGKVVNSYEARSNSMQQTSGSKVMAHNYSSNFIEMPPEKPHPDPEMDDLVDDWASLSLDEEAETLSGKHASMNRTSKADYSNFKDFLPRKLALMDVEEELPRLSPLPHTADLKHLTGAAPETFTQQVGIDAAFSSSDEPNALDTVLTGWDDSVLNITIPSFFSERLPATGVALAAISHPRSHSLSLFVKPHPDLEGSTSLLTLTPTPIHASRYYFPLIHRYTSHLSSINTYILQTVLAIRAAHRTATDLPSRFIEVARETLMEDQDQEPSAPESGIASSQSTKDIKLDLNASLYTAAATGFIPSRLRSWLTETLQERNLKRWDTAVKTGLADIVRLTHTYLLPALERATVIASRLRGLSRMDPQLPIWTVSEKSLTRIVTDLDSLRLIAHHILRYSAEELREFKLFSAWLSHILVIAAADNPEAPSAVDATEKISLLDIEPVLAYIAGPLSKSHLPYFLAREIYEVQKSPRQASLRINWDMLVRVLEGHKKRCIQPQQGPEGLRGGRVEVVNLLWWGLMMADGVTEVVKVPRECVARGIEFGEAIAVFADGNARMQDARMVDTKEGVSTLVLSFTANAPGALYIQRIQRMSCEDGEVWRRHVYLRLKVERTDVQPDDLLAVRFLSDEWILALVRRSDIRRRRKSRDRDVSALGLIACRCKLRNQNHNEIDVVETPGVWLQADITSGGFETSGEGMDCRLDYLETSKGTDMGVVVSLMAMEEDRFKVVRCPLPECAAV